MTTHAPFPHDLSVLVLLTMTHDYYHFSSLMKSRVLEGSLKIPLPWQTTRDLWLGVRMTNAAKGHSTAQYSSPGTILGWLWLYNCECVLIHVCPMALPCALFCAHFFGTVQSVIPETATICFLVLMLPVTRKPNPDKWRMYAFAYENNLKVN